MEELWQNGKKSTELYFFLINYLEDTEKICIFAPKKHALKHIRKYT